MAGLPPLVVKVVGDIKGLTQALDKAGGEVKIFGKGVSVGGVASMAAFAGGAAIAAKALLDMTNAAAADRDEQAKLAKTIANATGSTQDYTAAVDEAIAAGQAMAFSDSETRAALEPLVTSTGDVALATQQLAIAQDLARFAGVDLATAADAVAKAKSGQDKALKTLVPGLKIGADATETLGNAAKVAAGQADTFAKSSAGMAAKSGDALGELGETIGSALLPVLDELLPAILPIVKAFGELIKAVLPVLIPLVRVLAKVLGVALGIVLKVVGAIVRMIGVIADALKGLEELLRKIPGVSGAFDAIGGIVGGFSAGTPTGPTVGARAASPGGGSFAGGITINIVGDPLTIERTVVSALRTYGRRNGLSLAGLTD